MNEQNKTFCDLVVKKFTVKSNQQTKNRNNRAIHTVASNNRKTTTKNNSKIRNKKKEGQMFVLFGF